MLEPVIRKQYKIRISHNRIHMYLKHQGAAQDDERSRSAGVDRYERKHRPFRSHIDWHEMGWNQYPGLRDPGRRIQDVLAEGSSLRSILRTASLSSIRWLRGIGGSVR